MAASFHLFLIDSFGHADGSRGADQSAEVTADALSADDAGLTGFRVEGDSLMAAIHARNEAAATADALLAVYLREDDGFAVQMVGVQELRQLLAHQLLQMREAALGHVALEAEDEVVDDAVAVLHDGGAYLYVAAAQLDELKCVAPRLDTADAAKFRLWQCLCQFQYVPQCNRSHGATRIARDGALSGHLGLCCHRYRLDGVDGRDSVGTRLHTGSGRLGDVRDVGRHLRDDGNLHRTLHTGGIGIHQFRTLPHIAAHAFVLHLRTREVQFHGVAASRLSHPRQTGPLLLGLPHYRGDDHFRGVVLLQPPQDVKVHLHGVLAQLLHVAEAVEVAVDAVAVHRIETGRYLLDFLQADGFIEHTRSAGIEGAGHHLVVRADRRRGEEERVLAAYATECDM